MLTLLLALAAASEPGWLLLNATAIDADGPRTVEAIAIRGDRITSVGPRPEDTEGLQERDLHGAFVIPGLVDAHVHLSMTPSGNFLALSREAEEALWRHHLAAYVACGVTTVLDTGILPADARRMRELAAEGPAPDIQLLGPLLSPPGGYVHVVLPQFPATETPDQAAEQVREFAALGPVGVKLTVEKGMFLQSTWPTHSDAVVAAARDAAEAEGYGLYAHAMSTREYRMALDWGVAGFVHPPDKPSRKLVAELAAKQLPVVTTVSVFDTLLAQPEPERLDLAPLPLVVPRIELDAARDPANLGSFPRTVTNHITPRMPGFVRAMGARWLTRPGFIGGYVHKLQKSVLALHEAGVPLVVGSDSGNWPVFPFEFHGPTTLRELELLQEAGIPTQAVLNAATVNAASMLGLQEEIGRVAPGYRADLIVLSADPLADLSVLREPTLVIRAGTPGTPVEWMQGGPPEPEPEPEPEHEPASEPDQGQTPTDSTSP